MFKIGDRVKVVSAYSRYQKPLVGQRGTIIRKGKVIKWILKMDNVSSDFAFASDENLIHISNQLLFNWK